MDNPSQKTWSEQYLVEVLAKNNNSILVCVYQKGGYPCWFYYYKFDLTTEKSGFITKDYAFAATEWKGYPEYFNEFLVE